MIEYNYIYKYYLYYTNLQVVFKEKFPIESRPLGKQIKVDVIHSFTIIKYN